jgi:DNA-binding transcriptional LysR family regulator
MIVRRGRNYLGLTAEGERVLSWARHTLASLSSLREDAATTKASMSGTLRVGAIPTTMAIAAYLTGPSHAAYPNIRYTFSSLTADAIASQLDAFELDLGITYLDETALEGFEKLHLFEERYVLLGAKDAALESSMTWEQVASLPLCLLSGKMRNRQVIDTAFRRTGHPPNVILEADSLFALYAQVSEAGFYSVVPHSLLTFFDLQRVQARPILPQLTREIGLIARNQPALAPITAAVWQLARTLDLQSRFDRTLK